MAAVRLTVRQAAAIAARFDVGTEWDEAVAEAKHYGRGRGVFVPIVRGVYSDDCPGLFVKRWVFDKRVTRQLVYGPSPSFHEAVRAAMQAMVGAATRS